MTVDPRADISESSIRLDRDLRARLRCPVCGSGLTTDGVGLACTNLQCSTTFPVDDGVPVLLNERTSIFAIEEVRKDGAGAPSRNRLRAVRRMLIPAVSENIAARENYRTLTRLMLESSAAPSVLVVGGRVEGEGFGEVLSSRQVRVVETDARRGPRTALVCDAHDIPFADATFDGVIAQAMLEHVADPARCVDEIHRVLKPDGLVYAETPFMQQVHGGPYDFTRFTPLGHRRLFRRFDEVRSGLACGPGMALAWSYKYFLLSFVRARRLRVALDAFASLTSFWLKYVDRYLIDMPGSFDAASGCYFLGRKSARTLPDRELVALYRGAIRY
jgi:SAM-dependent methyltransferase